MIFMDTAHATDTAAVAVSPTKKRLLFSRLPSKRADDYKTHPTYKIPLTYKT